jgi:acyl-CoA synthetase (AMP-forming)/AMP-acid ligase II
MSGFMGALQDMRYEEEVGERLPPELRSMTSPAVVLSPMFHLSGMLPVLRAISVGVTFHVFDKWNVDVAFETMERVGLSRLGFVPTMLWDMLRSPKAGPKNLGQVRYVANGGAALNPALLTEMRALMPKALFTNTYGQSENVGWACTISGQVYRDHPDSCGWACPTVEVSARRDDGAEAGVGEPGEIWVRSPSVMTEYVNDPAATQATLRDGWCASGDIGFFDELGLLTIVDRKKNMVISGGENIYCAEVERVLFEHPAVAEAIAYGRPDPRLGERLVVTVVLEPGAELSEDEVKAYCRKRLALYKTPRNVVVTHAPLPRTASGKIDRGVFLRSLEPAIE